MANNPGLQARETEVEVSRQSVDQVALPDPQISASLFMNPMMLPMGNQLGSVSAMQMFPWFGSLDAMELEADRMTGVKQQAVLVAQNELIYKIKSVWYPLLELERIIEIHRENLLVLETDKTLATSRFQYAKGPMVDVIRVNIMIDELRTEISLIDQKRKPLAAALNMLLNRPQDISILPADDMNEPADISIPFNQTPVSKNPSLALFDKQIEVTEAQAVVADYQRKPMIGGGLQYMPQVKRKNGEVNIPPNTGRDMVMPMFTMTIPIWTKKYNAAVQERRLMTDMYVSMKKNMHNELAAMYEMTRYEIEKMQQMIELFISGKNPGISKDEKV
jgi:outer membrane protein TolC